jgi:sugar lactone lactonase YvrE
LYRVRTEVLRDTGAPPSSVEAGVAKVADTFPVDGLWMDKSGNLYLSGLTQSAVLRLSATGKMETMVMDPRLAWPDTFSEGPDGAIYITASHIHETARFNQGKSARKEPFAVFKFRP